jgi:hypothetical protein
LQNIDRSKFIGLKFNFLTIVKYLGEGNGSWLCLCDCGKFTKARMNTLTTGGKKSCGCFQTKWKFEKRKENKFIEYDDGVVVYDEEGRIFYVDKEDVETIKSFYWSVGYKGYVNGFENNKKISLHRFIMGATEYTTIDHINRNPSDNRKINLRFCTPQQNTFNKSLAKNNKSGVRGVYKSGNKWRAVIFYNNKNIHLGSHDLFEDAVAVRNEKAKELFGEFANIQ